MKKYTLVDADISTVSEKDLSSRNRFRSLSKAGTVVVALAFGTASLTGCFSDPASCSDSDVGADPPAAYDLGPNQDQWDYGGDSDAGVADPAGNGRYCADFD